MSETQLTCDGYIKEIIKSIMKLSNRHGTHSVFEDFLELSAISLSNSVDLKHYEEREKRYMEIIGGYTKEEVNIFPEIL
ncbi:MAG: hypothetical protein FWD48_04090, partial [Oscillospiraceae bacterium]|nr:hypothetical protein [Oscillospiraceae bacterium]